MSDSKKSNPKKVDTKEFELPETLYIRDIENRVFQGIILQCLAQVEGITLIEGTFIDNILGRGGLEGVKGISAEQDSKTYSVNIRIEVNIRYGIPIPEKAEEIQARVSDEITKLTGLHVSTVHVVFKNIFLPDQAKKGSGNTGQTGQQSPPVGATLGEEYIDEF